ncbi:MAG: SMP-30/gluconolactonase/LRE family protein [Anaerolineae bacterium]|nr:SMP-30/gluconolactonase/LRE family protein [Anaerolineae bacterium]
MSKLSKALLLVIVLISSIFPALAQDAAPEATDAAAGMSLPADSDLPASIEVVVPGLFPEGIEWDAAGSRFFLSSLSGQGIHTVTDDGTATPFAAAENGMSAIGIEIDEANNRLLVDYSDASVFSDQNATGMAALGIYDLQTADLINFVDLTSLYDGRHFANDVAVDADGNAYVTDSFSPVIYKVTPDGEASVFIEDEQLGSPNFGLNGIVYHPDGYLLANVAGSATLLKIPVDDPTALTPVEVSEPFGADGMFLDEVGNLIAVATLTGDDDSQSQAVISVSSADDWTSATVDQRVDTEGATTVTLRENVPYVIYAQLGQMGSNPPPESFEIGRIDFPAA